MKSDPCCARCLPQHPVVLMCGNKPVIGSTHCHKCGIIGPVVYLKAPEAEFKPDGGVQYLLPNIPHKPQG